MRGYICATGHLGDAPILVSGGAPGHLDLKDLASTGSTTGRQLPGAKQWHSDRTRGIIRATVEASQPAVSPQFSTRRTQRNWVGTVSAAGPKDPRRHAIPVGAYNAVQGKTNWGDVVADAKLKLKSKKKNALN